MSDNGLRVYGVLIGAILFFAISWGSRALGFGVNRICQLANACEATCECSVPYGISYTKKIDIPACFEIPSGRRVTGRSDGKVECERSCRSDLFSYGGYLIDFSCPDPE